MNVRKTTTVQVSLDPEERAMAKMGAGRDAISLSAYIGGLIRRDAEDSGVAALLREEARRD